MARFKKKNVAPATDTAATATDKVGGSSPSVTELLLAKHREAEEAARKAAQAKVAAAAERAKAAAKAKADREAKIAADRARREADRERLAKIAADRRKAAEEKAAKERAARTKELEDAFVAVNTAAVALASFMEKRDLLQRADAWPYQVEREFEKVANYLTSKVGQLEGRIIANANECARIAAGLPPSPRPLTRAEAVARLEAQREAERAERERLEAEENKREADRRRGIETA